MLDPLKSLELRAASDGRPTGITGYGAVFYDANNPATEYWLWDDIVERIMPGSFDRALREDDVRCCFNHDLNLILGRTSAGTLKLSLDQIGLRYEVSPSDSAIAQHPLLAVARGDVSGSSFMFEVGSVTWHEEKRSRGTVYIREINEVKPLYEIGPVCFPAFEATTAEVVSRSADGTAPSRFREWRQRHVDAARRDAAEIAKTLAWNRRRRKVTRMQQQLKAW